MSRVGIITLQGLYNYGNRLQNYAVQKIAKRCGLKVESILITQNLKTKKNSFVNFILESKSTNFFRYCLRFFNFWLFNKSYIKIKKFKYNKNVIEKINIRYNYLMLGGDQIWNQRYNIFGKLDKLGFQFGCAVDPEFRIPISPSFGESFIPDEKKEYCKKWLKDFKYISIREESGANIIKDLCNINAEILIDPVMMLTSDEWITDMRLRLKKKNSYCLTCFLGGTNEIMNRQLEILCNGYDIKGVGRYNDKQSWYGPKGFLSLIYNADLICTDSFHCLAFAILFKKPFVVFNRLNCDLTQMTRLNNLLSIFNMEERYIDRIDMRTLFDIDFSKTEEILNKERKRFINYINKWFNYEK